MVISWDIFPFRFSAVLGKKTNFTLEIKFYALDLCSKHAWGDICEKVSGNMSWNIYRDSLNCVANNEKTKKSALSGSKNQPPKLENSNCINSELNTALL